MSNSNNSYLEFMRQYWRPAMAMVYLVMCLLNYAVRPVVNTVIASKADIAEIVMVVKDTDPSLQARALELAVKDEVWKDVLPESVHITFGVILGVAAWTRGQEKIQTLKSQEG